MVLTFSPGLAHRGFHPSRGGFLLRRVVPSLVSIQVWSSQLSTGFETFPLAQREVAQSARSPPRWCSVQVKSERSPASKHVSAFTESGTTSLGTPKHSSEVSVLLRYYHMWNACSS